MFRIYLAGRYMLSRPISYLAMVCIGIAVMALITVVSIMSGFLRETRDIIRGTTADVIVSPFQDPTLSTPRAELERIARAHPDVQGACSRYVRPAVFKVRGSRNFNMGSSQWADLNQVLVLGLDPESERGVTDLFEYVVNVEQDRHAVDDPDRPFYIHRGNILEGRLRMADAPTLLMGEDLMEQLGLAKGMAIDLVTVPDGEDLFEGDVKPASETFVIAGAFRTGRYENDTGTLLVDRERFRRWTSAAGEVTELYVTGKPGADLSTLRDSLADDYGQAGTRVRVETWEDRHSVYLGAVENERNLMFLIVGFFVLLTCTITFAMVSMMAREKIRDIGILAAMGASPGGVGQLFGLCAAYVATLGCLFGYGTGTLLVLRLNAINEQIDEWFGVRLFRKDVYAFSEIPTELDPILNLYIAVTTILFAVVICSWPAFRAGRLDPVEALRHE